MKTTKPPAQPRAASSDQDGPQQLAASGEYSDTSSTPRAATIGGGLPESVHEHEANSFRLSQEVGAGASNETSADDAASRTVDFAVLRDGDSLGVHQIELGWKKDRLVVHGDVLRLKTALPTREYYPGGEVWSMGAAPGADARSDRMCLLLCAVTGFLLGFSALLSHLTSSPP